MRRERVRPDLCEPHALECKRLRGVPLLLGAVLERYVHREPREGGAAPHERRVAGVIQVVDHLVEGRFLQMHVVTEHIFDDLGEHALSREGPVPLTNKQELAAVSFMPMPRSDLVLPIL